MSTPILDETELFGRDVWCGTDGTVTGTYSEGAERVAQRLYNRVTTDTGELPEDRTYGYNVARLLNSDFSPGEISSAGQRFRAELMRDAAVYSCEATIDVLVDGPAIELRIVSTCVLKTGERLKLTMSVTEASTELLEVVIT